VTYFYTNKTEITLDWPSVKVNTSTLLQAFRGFPQHTEDFQDTV